MLILKVNLVAIHYLQKNLCSVAKSKARLSSHREILIKQRDSDQTERFSRKWPSKKYIYNSKLGASGWIEHGSARNFKK
jgi:hypothetical protein